MSHIHCFSLSCCALVTHLFHLESMHSPAHGGQAHLHPRRACRRGRRARRLRPYLPARGLSAPEARAATPLVTGFPHRSVHARGGPCARIGLRIRHALRRRVRRVRGHYPQGTLRARGGRPSPPRLRRAGRQGGPVGGRGQHDRTDRLLGPGGGAAWGCSSSCSAWPCS